MFSGPSQPAASSRPLRAGRLATAGVTFSPVAPSHPIANGWVLVSRDPDNIQLERFAPRSGRAA
jgi:hypothetical protein